MGTRIFFQTGWPIHRCLQWNNLEPQPSGKTIDTSLMTMDYVDDVSLQMVGDVSLHHDCWNCWSLFCSTGQLVLYGMWFTVLVPKEDSFLSYWGPLNSTTNIDHQVAVNWFIEAMQIARTTPLPGRTLRLAPLWHSQWTVSAAFHVPPLSRRVGEPHHHCINIWRDLLGNMPLDQEDLVNNGSKKMQKVVY